MHKLIHALVLFFSLLNGYAQYTPTADEKQSFEEAQVPIEELEKYRALYGNQVLVEQVIERYQKGHRISGYFKVNLNDPSDLKLHSDFFRWLEPHSVSPHSLAQIKKQFLENPEIFQELKQLSQYSNDYHQLLKLRNSLTSINPECLSLAGLPSEANLIDTCSKVTAGHLAPEELLELAKNGAKETLLFRTPEIKKKTIDFIRAKQLIYHPDLSFTAAQLMNNFVRLNELKDEECIKIAKVFQQAGLIADVHLNFSDPQALEMIRALKISELGAFPLSVSIPLIETFFQSHAENCLKQNLVDASKLNAITQTLSTSLFKNHIEDYLKLFKQTFIRPKDTIVHIGHDPEEATGKWRGGPYKDSWNSRFIQEIGKKLNAKTYTFLPKEGKPSASEIQAGFQQIAETHGPLTIVLFGHGSETGTVCIERRNLDSAKIRVDSLLDALFKKREHDPDSQSPITVVIHSCHAQAIGTLLLEKWKEKSKPDYPAPVVVTTAGGYFDGNAFHSLPMLRESIRSFEKLASQTQSSGITGRDLLQTLGTVNFFLNDHSISNNLVIQTLCQNSNPKCTRVIRY